MSYFFESAGSGGDYFDVTDTSILSIPDDEWCMQVFIKRDQISTDTSSWSSEYLFSNGGFSSANTFHVYINHTDNSINAKLTGGSGEVFHANSSANACNSTNWICLHIQRESDGDIYFYRDNTAYSSEAFTQAQSATIDLASGFNVGRRGDANTARYYDGYLAEWAFWSGRSLDSGERASLIAGGGSVASDLSTSLNYYRPFESDLTTGSGTLSITNNGAAQDAEHPSVGGGGGGSAIAAISSNHLRMMGV